MLKKLNLKKQAKSLRLATDIIDLKRAYKIINEALQSLNVPDLSTETVQNFVNQQFERVRDVIIPENAQDQENLYFTIFYDTRKQFLALFNLTE